MKTVTYDEKKWKIVPKKSTPDMQGQGIMEMIRASKNQGADHFGQMAAAYEGMLSIAPDYSDEKA